MRHIKEEIVNNKNFINSVTFLMKINLCFCQLPFLQGPYDFSTGKIKSIFLLLQQESKKLLVLLTGDK